MREDVEPKRAKGTGVKFAYDTLRDEILTQYETTEREFHDRILREGVMPIELLRSLILDKELTRDFKPDWKFLG